jgi:hypothetical protein
MEANNMENETKQGTLKIMDDGKLVKAIKFDLVWQGGQALLVGIRKLIDIPDGLHLKTISERWASRTNVLGFELSMDKRSHYGSTHLFRRVILKPRIDIYNPISTLDLSSLRLKMTELMPSLLAECEFQGQVEQERQRNKAKRTAFALLLAQLAEQYGWDCEIPDSIYRSEDVEISRQTDIGEISIDNGYGDVKITIALKDYSPTTLEKLVHFLSK